jgi:hypothetical protein
MRGGPELRESRRDGIGALARANFERGAQSEIRDLRDKMLIGVATPDRVGRRIASVPELLGDQLVWILRHVVVPFRGVWMLQRGARVAPDVDRTLRVLGDEIGVDGRGGGYTVRGGANDGGRQIGDVPRHPDTRQIRQASGIRRDELTHAQRVKLRLESKRNQDLLCSCGVTHVISLSWFADALLIRSRRRYD